MKYKATQMALPFEDEEQQYISTVPKALLANDKQQVSVVPKALPFIKWVGGKRKLVDSIISAAPSSFERYLISIILSCLPSQQITSYL